MRLVGIDPGKKGGIVLLEWGSPKELLKMPLVNDDIDVGAVAEFLSFFRPDLVAIERAQSMPGQGVVSMFSYGVGYGKLLGVVQTLRLAHQTVPPQTWQAWAHRTIKVTGSDPKAKALAVARALYPTAELIPARGKVPHEGIVDALLIAGYADHVLSK